MPRLYITPNDFLSYPAAITFQFQITQLQSVPGGVDRLLAQASKRVDGYAKKRIQAPPSTMIAAGGIAAGGTSLLVTSTLGFDNGQEQAVIIGTGGTQETIPIVPGGVTITSWSSPYPGSITLAQGVTYNHLSGEAVQGCYQEVSTVGSSSSDDVLSQSMVQFDQGAQVAAAHSPYYGTAMLTRVIFLKCYPITSILKLEHMLPFASEYGAINLSGIGIQKAAGYVRLTLGSFVLPDGLMRTTYQAGFANVPDDIAEATAWYAADELQSIKSGGAYEVQRGKVRTKYAEGSIAKSIYVQKAEQLIDDGNYRRCT